jgi:hypothetical protein
MLLDRIYPAANIYTSAAAVQNGMAAAVCDA